MTALSRNFDVFRCSIADIDKSFEFEYYKDGDLVRELIFAHDMVKNTESLSLDIGDKKAGEPDDIDNLLSCAEKMFTSIVQALGIERVTEPLRNRYYSKCQNLDR